VLAAKTFNSVNTVAGDMRCRSVQRYRLFLFDIEVFGLIRAASG